METDRSDVSPSRGHQSGDSQWPAERQGTESPSSPWFQTLAFRTERERISAVSRHQCVVLGGSSPRTQRLPGRSTLHAASSSLLRTCLSTTATSCRQDLCLWPSHVPDPSFQRHSLAPGTHPNHRTEEQRGGWGGRGGAVLAAEAAAMTRLACHHTRADAGTLTLPLGKAPVEGPR